MHRRAFPLRRDACFTSWLKKDNTLLDGSLLHHMCHRRVFYQPIETKSENNAVGSRVRTFGSYTAADGAGRGSPQIYANFRA
jgi:hypothetical protein